MPDLSRKGARQKLQQRREPWWHKLDAGAYLGFRRGPDTWIARYRDRSGSQQYKSLSVPRDSHDEFITAKKLAGDWFSRIGGSAARTARRETVRAALAAYIEDLRRVGRAEAARAAAATFRVTVPEGDPLGDLRLEDATREDFEAWRDRLRPGRHIRSVNRYTGSLAAGLNAALELGHVGDPRAWTMKTLVDDAEHDEATAVFLSSAQRTALLASADPSAADFFRGVELTGCRPGELARTTVADFDGEQIRFTHRKGRPPKLRTRHTVLSAEGCEFFRRMCRDKLPAAHIFVDANHEKWTHQNWGYAFRKAVAAHDENKKGRDRLPPGASAYSFRHSRISELLQLHGVDPLTVAQQTGTSLVQIEKTYLKFIKAAMKEKLAAVREVTA